MVDCKELGLKGLEYVDQDGQTKLIPRFKDNNGEYEFTKTEQEIRESYFTSLCIKYPNVDKMMIKILVDSYIKHPEEFEENVKKTYNAKTGEYENLE
jgi:hypothetical protein